MSKDRYISDFLSYHMVEPYSTPSTKVISYSQLSNFRKCPNKWKLDSVEKVTPFSPSIHLVFGTSMHWIVQAWLLTMYKFSNREAKEMDLKGMLLQRLSKDYKEYVEKNNGEHFSNKEEMRMFYSYGCAVLEFLQKKRADYFRLRDWELYGIEVPIWISPSKEKEGVKFVGFIDLVIYDKKVDEYIIIDIKTSMKGWSKWAKKDKSKTDQIVLYKKYFAEQYGIDPKQVVTQFFILKSTIDEDSLWPQKRVQLFSPSDGSVSMNKAQNEVDFFLETCFNEEGKIKKDLSHLPAVSGEKGWNCTFCPYKDDEVNCPKENRIEKWIR